MQVRMGSEPVMSPTGNTIPRPPVARLLVAQFLLGGVVCLLALVLGEPGSIGSALAGTMTAVLPNMVFVAVAFRHTGARAARRSLGDLYLAEACKFLLTLGMFAWVFASLRPLAPGWVFGAYIAALMAYWLSPWLMARRATEPTAYRPVS